MSYRLPYWEDYRVTREFPDGALIEGLRWTMKIRGMKKTKGLNRLGLGDSTSGTPLRHM